MTVLAVHGALQTGVLWDPLRAQLDGVDLIAAELPGFGAPCPAMWSATMDDYAARFESDVDQVVATHGPVDLLGHAWGSVFVLRVAALRPDLVRSWVVDYPQILHPSFTWHDHGLAWSTPGVGEQYFEQVRGLSIDQRRAVLIDLGMAPPAVEMTIALFETEAVDCTLALYRSATPEARIGWWHHLVGALLPRGLVLVAADNVLRADARVARLVADELGVPTHELGADNWWPLTDASSMGEVLREFWEQQPIGG